MKSCPACNRTFEDTFTFCLVDGAILSAPFDPQATRQNPVARDTAQPPTEVFPPYNPANRNALPPTIRSPQPGYTPASSGNAMPHAGQPQFFQGQYYPKSVPQKKSSRLWIVSLALFVIWFLGIGLRVGGGLIHSLFVAALIILIIHLVKIAKSGT